MAKQSREGEILAGKYRLEKLLGRGAVGAVYRAQNTLIGRIVAIKVLRPEHASDDETVARFMREARAANLVRHPNVVDVLDIGQDEDGIPFIVEEFLEGKDLAKHTQQRGGTLSVSEILELMVPVAEAVGLAHSRSVVHRDLKPENIFLANTEKQVVPKLLDFGLSRMLVTPGDIRMTTTGMTMGSPAYMSPEQVEGSKELDASSDVWALGVILYELLSGRLPFMGQSHVALFVQITSADPQRLETVAPHVPPDLARVVTRCLRRNPAERYPTALELARDLRHVREGAELEPTMRRSLQVTLASPATTARAEERGRSPGANAVRVRSKPETRRGAPQARRKEEPIGGDGCVQPLTRAAILESEPDSTASGLRVATLRPPPKGPRPPAQPAPEEPDARVFWDAATLALVVFTVAGVMMLALHRPGGWPLAQWIHGALDGSQPVWTVVAMAASLGGSIRLAMYGATSQPRSWGVLLTALGLFSVGAPAAIQVIGRLSVGHDDIAGLGSIPPIVPWGLAVVPLGLGLTAMKMGWDEWRTRSPHTKLRGAGLACIATPLLFATIELVRAALA